MLNTITITAEDILKEVKLSCKIPEIVELILTRQIMNKYAEEAGIEVDDQALQATADTLRMVYKIPSAEQTWDWLKTHGLSLDDFEEIAYTSLISGKLAKHLFDNEVEAYFYENKLGYAGVIMYEIVLDDQDLAMELYYTIQEGETSFYDAAHKYIQDIELRRKGGYRGILNRQDLKPEVSAAVFSAHPPQLLKPIISSSGVHLILVEEIIEPTQGS